MTHQAEKLKIKFGCALADEVFDNRIITIPGLKGHEPREISEKNLARIIQARMEEILDYVAWEIRKSGLERKLIAGVVFTGGGSLLKDIELLAQYQLGKSARIGIPTEVLAHGYTEQVNSPVFATSIGLLLKGIEDRAKGATFEMEAFRPEERSRQDQSQQENWLGKLFDKTRSFF